MALHLKNISSIFTVGSLKERTPDSLAVILKHLEDCTEVAIHENKEIERYPSICATCNNHDIIFL